MISSSGEDRVMDGLHLLQPQPNILEDEIYEAVIADNEKQKEQSYMTGGVCVGHFLDRHGQPQSESNFLIRQKKKYACSWLLNKQWILAKKEAQRTYIVIFFGLRLNTIYICGMRFPEDWTKLALFMD